MTPPVDTAPFSQKWQGFTGLVTVEETGEKLKKDKFKPTSALATIFGPSFKASKEDQMQNRHSREL